MNMFAKLVRGLAVVCAAAFASAALAQSGPYPNRPIRLITPFPPGGVTDVLSRIIADNMSKQLKEAVVVDNRAGATGLLGTELAARADPDGYTVVNVISTHAVHHHLRKKVPFDYIKDFAPIAAYAKSTLAFVVHPSIPVHNVAELVAYIKARKEPFPYGTSGIGSAVHLTMESFAQAAGLQVQSVTFNGGGPAVQSVLGGHVPGVILGYSTVASYVKNGQLRAIFVSSAKRHPDMPDVPTLQESGYPGLVNDEWWALLAPAKTPKPVVDTLNAEITRIFTLPDVQERLVKLGVEFVKTTPEQTIEFMQAESAKGAKIIRAAKIEVE